MSAWDKFWDRVVNLVNQQVEAHMAKYTHPRIGIVTSYDPKTYSAKMTVQPEGWETAFIFLGAHHIGNGYGSPTGANIGDQYLLNFLGGNVEAPIVVCRVFSNQEVAPNVKAGEMLHQHQSGSKHFMDENGNISHVANKGYTLTSGEAVTINSGAPISITGGGNLA